MAMKAAFGKVFIAVVLVCAAAGFGSGFSSGFGSAHAHAGVTHPEPPRGKGENCVEPTDLMRKNHMDFLDHQRDATVHDGVRGTRHSLVGCVECHTQKDSGGQFIAINAPGQFCERCHRFTGVTLDCFECHATRPDDSNSSGHGGEVSLLSFPSPHRREMTAQSRRVCSTAPGNPAASDLDPAAAASDGAIQ